MGWVWYWDYGHGHWSSYWDSSQQHDYYGYSNYTNYNDHGNGSAPAGSDALPNDVPLDGNGSDGNGGADTDSQWTTPDTLMKAEVDYRLRSLLITPLEYEHVLSHLPEDGGEEHPDKKLDYVDRPCVTRLTKQWGRAVRLKDHKDVLVKLQAKAVNVVQGSPIEPGSLEFAFAKGFLSAGREADRKITGSLHESNPCYCLPTMFLKGCGHKGSLVAPCFKGPRDSMCKHCSKCMRCGKLL